MGIIVFSSDILIPSGTVRPVSLALTGVNSLPAIKISVDESRLHLIPGGIIFVRAKENQTQHFPSFFFISQQVLSLLDEMCYSDAKMRKCQVTDSYRIFLK